MKRIKYLLLIIVLILITGCVKYDLDMNIGTDKSITITIIDAMLEDYSSMGSYDEETYSDLGYTVSSYDDGEYTGLEMKKTFDSIDDISSSDCGTIELTDLISMDTSEVVLFKSSKSGDVTTYNADFTYNLTEEETEDDEDVDYSAYTDSMSFSYSITLPSNSKIISNNADIISSDGYTLSWNVEYGELKKINFSFTFDDNDITEVVEDSSSIDTESTSSDETIETEVEEETETMVTLEGASIISYILSFAFIIAIIGALIYIKIGVNRKKKYNSNDPIYHSVPPQNK